MKKFLETFGGRGSSTKGPSTKSPGPRPPGPGPRAAGPGRQATAPAARPGFFARVRAGAARLGRAIRNRLGGG